MKGVLRKCSLQIWNDSCLMNECQTNFNFKVSQNYQFSYLYKNFTSYILLYVWTREHVNVFFHIKFHVSIFFFILKCLHSQMFQSDVYFSKKNVAFILQ